MSVGSNRRQCENSERQPAVSCQFSPLMSCTRTECGHDKSVGTTSQHPCRTGSGQGHDMVGPVMAKVGASAWPRNTPAGFSKPDLRRSLPSAQRAEPKVETRLSHRARRIDPVTAITMAATPPEAAISPPRSNTSGA